MIIAKVRPRNSSYQVEHFSSTLFHKLSFSLIQVSFFFFITCTIFANPHFLFLLTQWTADVLQKGTKQNQCALPKSFNSSLLTMKRYRFVTKYCTIKDSNLDKYFFSEGQRQQTIKYWDIYTKLHYFSLALSDKCDVGCTCPFTSDMQ